METPLKLKNRHGLSLAAVLLVPDGAKAPPVVAFAHGWGSSKASPRNREIADALVDAGIAAFLFDFTGHGDSEGDANATGLREQSEDLTDALDFLAVREPRRSGSRAPAARWPWPSRRRIRACARSCCARRAPTRSPPTQRGCARRP
jgi:fermentation-respiration switch protein FrsA (DUF1100 family)